MDHPRAVRCVGTRQRVSFGHSHGIEPKMQRGQLISRLQRAQMNFGVGIGWPCLHNRHFPQLHAVKFTRGAVPCVTASIDDKAKRTARSEEHTSELQSLMRISYAVFCLKKKKHIIYTYTT